MLADEVVFVVGVDTHAEAHALVLVEAQSQCVRGSLTIEACRGGYRRGLRFARRQAPGARVWALEGSGSYGAGLARFLVGQGERVLEVERPTREGRQGRFKSDLLDAERAARLVLSHKDGAAPRLGAQTQALRALLVTREGAVKACTAALNELRALLLGCPPELRERPQGQSEAVPLDSCLRLRGLSGEGERAACVLSLRSLARRLRQLRAESKTLETELLRRVQTLAPELLVRRGVGPISAATLLVAWSSRRPSAKRGGFRPPGRRRADPRQHRQDRPPPAPPRRRPPPQPRPAHDRAHPPPPRPRHQDLHRPPPQRRQKRTRRSAPPQTLPRPLPLPHTGGHANHLTDIEASPVASPGVRLQPHPAVDRRVSLRSPLVNRPVRA